MFWVTGGTAGVFSVQKAGLAVAIGTWSPTSVLTSFIWGYFIFEEKTESPLKFSLAILLLITGIVGMSRYSDKKDRVNQNDTDLYDQENASSKAYQRLICKAAEKNIEEKEILLIQPSKKIMDEDDSKIWSKKYYHIQNKNKKNALQTFYKSISQRNLGILAALFNGSWGSMSMVPMQYAR